MKSHTILATAILSAGLLSTVSVQAASYSYNFTGTFSDQFATIVDSGAPVIQTGGALNYSTPTPLVAAQYDQVYTFNAFVPTFNQSWSAQIDVKVPLTLDSLSASNWYMGAGIGVVATAGDGTNYVFGNALEISPAGRKYNPEYYVDNIEIGNGLGVTPTSMESDTLTLSYDATTRTFAAGNHSGVFRTLDASSFSKMQGTDQMSIFIDFSTDAAFSGLAIPASTPLTLSNFSVTTPVPVPATAWLFGSGLIGLVGVARKRKAA